MKICQNILIYSNTSVKHVYHHLYQQMGSVSAQSQQLILIFPTIHVFLIANQIYVLTTPVSLLKMILLQSTF